MTAASRKGHEPERTCIGCRRKEPARNLVRLALNRDGGIVIDRDRRMPGRGAWIHPKPECIDRGARLEVLDRAFRKKFEPGEAGRIRESLINALAGAEKSFLFGRSG